MIKVDDETISVKGTTLDLLIDVSTIMSDLMKSTPITREHLICALAIAVKANEEEEKGNHIRESFMDNLFK